MLSFHGYDQSLPTWLTISSLSNTSLFLGQLLHFCLILNLKFVCFLWLTRFWLHRYTYTLTLHNIKYSRHFPLEKKKKVWKPTSIPPVPVWLISSKVESVFKQGLLKTQGHLMSVPAAVLCLEFWSLSFVTDLVTGPSKLLCPVPQAYCHGLTRASVHHPVYTDFLNLWCFGVSSVVPPLPVRTPWRFSAHQAVSGRLGGFFGRGSILQS